MRSKPSMPCLTTVATLTDLTTFLATLPEHILLVLEGPGSGWLEGEEAWMPFQYFHTWSEIPQALAALLAHTARALPDLDDANPAWQCQAGHMHGMMHCPETGEQPPYGCPCAACQADDDEAGSCWEPVKCLS